MVEDRTSGLEAHLGYWLRYVSNHVSHAFAAKLAGRGVTVAEWVVLRQLYDDGALAPSLLATRLGMTRGAISKLADRLAAKSLIVRKDSKRDRRSHKLEITSEGRALVPELTTLADRNEEEFFGHLSPRERREIAEAMMEIVRRGKLRIVPID
jgi:MarR family transcriptional regulator, lower aerobic nicotinate degradation pathway regulator